MCDWSTSCISDIIIIISIISPDLLYHQEYSRDESQAKDETMYSYPRVDWFDHPSPSPPPYHDRQDSRVQETILSWPMQEVASMVGRRRR